MALFYKTESLCALDSSFGISFKAQREANARSRLADFCRLNVKLGAVVALGDFSNDGQAQTRALCFLAKAAIKGL